MSTYATDSDIEQGHQSEIEAKSHSIDEDQDGGEYHFEANHPFHDSLHNIVITYNYERNIQVLREHFRGSPEIHAILGYARIDDLQRYCTSDTVSEHDDIRRELIRIRDW